MYNVLALCIDPGGPEALAVTNVRPEKLAKLLGGFLTSCMYLL